MDNFFQIDTAAGNVIDRSAVVPELSSRPQLYTLSFFVVASQDK
jgi:hypothetical protein